MRTRESAVVALDDAVEQARADYVACHPRARALHERARAVLPGGNTRTVLYHPPFPLRVARAWDAVLEDVDGHRYVNLLGEYSAGLYGHSHPVIQQAMRAAIDDGLSRSAHTEHEVLLAEAMCERFGSVHRVRFTNSGTEANLMALAAARAYTGRERVVGVHGGYHGGLLTFRDGASAVNAPYDVTLVPYNDVAAARAAILDGSDPAAVLVEPMLGASGCIPGEPEFLAALREAASETGALLVLDEVMTSRTGAGGLQQPLGIVPDLTTFGKYLGGGSSFGAFGGRGDVMDLFDPSRSDALQHAGTFNNNVISMAAGHVGLTTVYTPEVAERHTARGDALRADLDAAALGSSAPFQVCGVGSLMSFHPTRAPIRRHEDLAGTDPRLLELLFLDLLAEGYYLAPRGYLALSLAVTDEQQAGFVAAVGRVLSARSSLWS